MIIGGQAVLIYGEPRITRDIDITLGVYIDRHPEIKLIVKKLNLKHLVENLENFVEETIVLPAIE